MTDVKLSPAQEWAKINHDMAVRFNDEIGVRVFEKVIEALADGATNNALLREAAAEIVLFRSLIRAADKSGLIFPVKGARSFDEGIDHCTSLIQRLEEAGKDGGG